MLITAKVNIIYASVTFLLEYEYQTIMRLSPRTWKKWFVVQDSTLIFPCSKNIVIAIVAAVMKVRYIRHEFGRLKNGA